MSVATTSTTAATSTTVKRKLRPARKQVKPGEIDKSEGPQPGKEYNVWYNKWAGGDKEDALANLVVSYPEMQGIREPMRRETSSFVYSLRVDAVHTGESFRWCDGTVLRSGTNAIISIDSPSQTVGIIPQLIGFFLRSERRVMEVVLTPDSLADHSRDCFGREKHSEYRDDMGGVGSFNRTNRTLYVAKMQESPDKEQTKETLLRHFGEWGKIVKSNILYNRGIAFVTYESEHNAQFAKEAMANQSMDMEEVLNVRWAAEDPNVEEQKKEEVRIQEEGQKAIAGMLDENLVEATQTLRALEEGDEEDFYPIEAPKSPSPPPEETRKRIRNGGDDEPSGREAKKSNGGILNEEAMDNLRFYAEMARKQAESRQSTKPAPVKAGMGGLLGGYGSGDESD